MCPCVRKQGELAAAASDGVRGRFNFREIFGGISTMTVKAYELLTTPAARAPPMRTIPLATSRVGHLPTAAPGD
jgi:hypothetical protein